MAIMPMIAATALGTSSLPAWPTSVLVSTAVEVALGPAVQQVPQRRQHRSLAGLARRMQHEVPHLPDQSQNGLQVHPIQRRHAVVARRYDGSFGIEKAHSGRFGAEGGGDCRFAHEDGGV